VSTGRIPYAGSANSLLGQDSIPSVFGPMSNSIYGLKLFIQSVLSRKPWLYDPLVNRQAWDEDEYKLVEHGGGKQLCFGVIRNDGVIVPHPPVQRGVDMAVKAVVAAGHKVIDWKPLKHKEITDCAMAIWGSAAWEDYKALLSETGEPIITSMQPGEETSSSKPIIPTSSKSAYELWQFHKAKGELRQEYLDHWRASVNETGTGRPVDALISPVSSYTAPPHGNNSSARYTIIWNTLDYPAVIIPVSKVDPALDLKKPAHEFLSDADRANYELYDPEIFKDAPVSIQIIAKRQEDEAVLRMAEIVDDALKAHVAGKL